MLGKKQNNGNFFSIANYKVSLEKCQNLKAPAKLEWVNIKIPKIPGILAVGSNMVHYCLAVKGLRNVLIL